MKSKQPFKYMYSRFRQPIPKEISKNSLNQNGKLRKIGRQPKRTTKENLFNLTRINKIWIILVNEKQTTL